MPRNGGEVVQQDCTRMARDVRGRVSYVGRVVQRWRLAARSSPCSRVVRRAGGDATEASSAFDAEACN